MLIILHKIIILRCIGIVKLSKRLRNSKIALGAKMMAVNANVSHMKKKLKANTILRVSWTEHVKNEF